MSDQDQPQKFNVMKPFNTVNRRLSPGEGPGGSVMSNDDLSPFTLEERVEHGFLQLATDKAAAAAEPPPASPPAPEPEPFVEEPAGRPGRGSSK